MKETARTLENSIEINASISIAKFISRDLTRLQTEGQLQAVDSIERRERARVCVCVVKERGGEKKRVWLLLM